jgi:branched-chain amino acid transport system permease protein
VLGAVTMSLVSEILSTNLPRLHTIIFGALVIVLIIWCPGGMIQAFATVRAKWARRAPPTASEAIR